MNLVLRYRRDAGTDTSTGELQVGDAPPHTFIQLAFKQMLVLVHEALKSLPEEVEVHLQRTDRGGLIAYALDRESVRLLRDDPVAAIAMFSPSTGSPSVAEKRVRAPVLVPCAMPAGFDTFAETFGDEVYFKVRRHELECPGCGYWGSYTTPALLVDADRAGEVFKTVFACHKRCLQRFHVTCQERWGSVRVEDLLKTNLTRFYLPRTWNSFEPWVGREVLQKKYDAYKIEKEKVT